MLLTQRHIQYFACACSHTRTHAHTNTHTHKTTGILLFYFMPCILVSKCFGKWIKEQFYLNNNNNNSNNISMIKTTYLLIKLKISVYVILSFSGFTHLLQNHLAQNPNRYSVKWPVLLVLSNIDHSTRPSRVTVMSINSNNAARDVHIPGSQVHLLSNNTFTFRPSHLSSLLQF
jgi:hypothetical protein